MHGRWALVALVHGAVFPFVVAAVVLAGRTVLGLPVHDPVEVLESLLMVGPWTALPGVALAGLVWLLLARAPSSARGPMWRGAAVGAVVASTALGAWFYGVHWDCMLGSTGDEKLHCWMSFCFLYGFGGPVAVPATMLGGAAAGGFLGWLVSQARQPRREERAAPGHGTP